MITTFVTIIYVIVSLMLILGILLQSGKGGGLSGALGGGAAQNVFGGGGGADFMSKLTQSFAALFMLCALYLAYDSAHSGSAFLQQESKEEDALANNQVTEDGEINYEQVGPNPLSLPAAGTPPKATNTDSNEEEPPSEQPDNVDSENSDNSDSNAAQVGDSPAIEIPTPDSDQDPNTPSPE